MTDTRLTPTKRKAAVIALIALAVTGVSAYLTATQLGVHTDPADLLSEELPFRQTRMRYERQFPLNDQPLILVIDADTPERADEAVDRLEARLDADDAFGPVYQPRGGPYLRRHALLYMTPEELQHLADGLSQSQALMARLAESPRSTTLFSTLSDALDADTQVTQVGEVMRRVAVTVEEQVNDQPHEMSWQTLLSDELDPGTQRVLVAHPELNFRRVMSGKQALEAARRVADDLSFNNGQSVTMRITGKVALSHEEVQTVLEGMVIATPLALMFVAMVLYFALRSVRLMLATIVVLLVGLVWTTGLAAITVGHLNLISIAFGVLYVGLGVDFAIHYLLRYRACLERGANRFEGLLETMRQTGGALALCALTTAIGFFAFVPTSFTGVSELGIIGGCGMIISFVATLVLLPAIIMLLPEHRDVAPPRQAARIIGAILRVPLTHRVAVLVVAAALAIVAIALVPSVRFNPDPLDLRDPASESVSTLRDMYDKSTTAHWSATALASNADQARQLARTFASMNGVDKAITVFDLIPKKQDAKLAVIDDMNLLLGPSLSDPADPETSDTPPGDLVEAWRASMLRLLDSIDAARQRTPNSPIIGHAQTLADALRTLLTKLDGEPDDRRFAAMREMDRRLLGTFPATIRWLREALTAERVTMESLPYDLRARWVSNDGVYRIEIIPAWSLDDDEQRQQFVDQIRAVTPEVTGPPILHVESADTVVEAFRSALIYAVIGITLIVLVQLRNVWHTLVVLLPLLLGGGLTAAGMVLMDMPFNFANVIALPLLLGIGVDNGIHMVHRSRAAMPGHGNLLETVPARAVLYSTLTTLCSFGNLSLSPHPGTASMGVVLTTGIVIMMMCTLILLPAMLNPRGGHAGTE